MFAHHYGYDAIHKVCLASRAASCTEKLPICQLWIAWSIPQPRNVGGGSAKDACRLLQRALFHIISIPQACMKGNPHDRV